MIPSIASRLDILADIADQMDQNEDNRNNVQKQLFFKYLIESIQKQQQQDKPIDCSTKITYPFGSNLSSDNFLNSNENPLKEFYKRIQHVQEHLVNINQQNSIINSLSTNSIPPKKRYKSNSSLSPPPPPPSDVNQDDPYSERRRKNNEAAKRSRDTRRAKEDEIALRAALLEQENVKLRLENVHLKQENIQLRCQIYSSTES